MYKKCIKSKKAKKKWFKNNLFSDALVVEDAPVAADAPTDAPVPADSREAGLSVYHMAL